MSNDKKNEIPAAPVVPVMAAPEDAMKKLGFTAEQIQFINQLVITATVTAVQSIPKQNNANNNVNKKPIVQCGKCFQNENACKGKHVKMVVYPERYPEFAKWWPGVVINGVRYISHTPNVKILVPEKQYSTIVNAIKTFEENERTVNISRSKTHVSGSIGRRGTGAVKAEMAWR